MKRKIIKNLKKALEWWKVKEVILKKNNLIEEDKRIFYLSMKLLNATKLLIIENIKVQKT